MTIDPERPAPTAAPSAPFCADCAAGPDGQWADALALAWQEHHRLRTLLAERSAELALAQTEAFQLRREAETGGATRNQMSRLESELNALRYRLDEAETTLARFRKSLSWRMTTPIRWIGRVLKLNQRRAP